MTVLLNNRMKISVRTRNALLVPISCIHTLHFRFLIVEVIYYNRCVIIIDKFAGLRGFIAI